MSYLPSSAGAFLGPVNTVADIFKDSHADARGMLPDVEQPGLGVVRIAGTPIRMTKTQGGVARRAALLGEDTIAILSSAGYDQDEISALEEAGAVQ